MFSKKVRLSLPIFLVLALCVFPTLAQAGTFDSGARRVSLLGQVQSVAEMLWSSVSAIWNKEGVSIDPNGAPGVSGTGGSGTSGSTGSGSGPTGEGASIDPNGNGNP